MLFFLLIPLLVAAGLLSPNFVSASRAAALPPAAGRLVPQPVEPPAPLREAVALDHEPPTREPRRDRVQIPRRRPRLTITLDPAELVAFSERKGVDLIRLRPAALLRPVAEPVEIAFRDSQPPAPELPDGPPLPPPPDDLYPLDDPIYLGNGFVDDDFSGGIPRLGPSVPEPGTGLLLGGGILLLACRRRV